MLSALRQRHFRLFPSEATILPGQLGADEWLRDVRIFDAAIRDIVFMLDSGTLVCFRRRQPYCRAAWHDEWLRDIREFLILLFGRLSLCCLRFDNGALGCFRRRQPYCRGSLARTSGCATSGSCCCYSGHCLCVV